MCRVREDDDDQVKNVTFLCTSHLRLGGCKALLSATVHRHLSLPNIFTATAIAFTDPLTTTTVHHRHPLAHTHLTGGTLTTLILACEFTSGQPVKIATMDIDLESLLDKYTQGALMSLQRV